jgi:hypothetical protein
LIDSANERESTGSDFLINVVHYLSAGLVVVLPRVNADVKRRRSTPATPMKASEITGRRCLLHTIKISDTLDAFALTDPLDIFAAENVYFTFGQKPRKAILAQLVERRTRNA